MKYIKVHVQWKNVIIMPGDYSPGKQQCMMYNVICNITERDIQKEVPQLWNFTSISCVAM